MKTAGDSTIQTKRLTVWLFIYTFCFAGFQILPAFLSYDIQNKFVVGDALDLFTPFVLLLVIFKLYTLFYISRNNTHMPFHIIMTLFIGSITFVEGHGIHMAANAIARHLYTFAVHNTPLFALTYFFDETLGHILWDSGLVLISIGLIFSGITSHEDKTLGRKSLLVLIASLFYGFTYFVNGVEGQTVLFTLPLAFLIPIAILLYGKVKKLKIARNPVLLLFTCAYLVALLLFLIWWIWQKGFPEFSELGWI